MAKQTITYDPQVLDLVLYAGDGANFRLVVTDADNNVIPLTGTMEAQVRLDRDFEDSPILEFNINLDEATEGVAVLSLTGEQTQSLSEGQKFTGVWDLQWTPLGVEPSTLCQGKVEVYPDVSR